MKVLLLILFGFLGGIFGGMGMGGGTLLIPLLTVFLHIDQQGAQAINLLCFIPMSVVALIIHIKNKLVKGKTLWSFLLPALISSALGSLLALKLPGGSLKQYFGIFLILLGAFALGFEIYNHFKNKKAGKY